MTTATLLHWALLNIVQSITTTGFQIAVYTNNPCHLWLRYTAVQWRKHITVKIERGAPIDKGARYCFVSYKDNEQLEEGDTLEHTFIKEPWTACETRWFYFFGTVGSINSPSESPIFSKHRPFGLLFADQYTLAAWPPVAPLFQDGYNISPYPPPFAILFTEAYSW